MKTTTLGSVALLLLTCTLAQADPLELAGFSGTFGTTSVDGATLTLEEGEALSDGGFTATITDLPIVLSDPVTVEDPPGLLLTGTGAVSGSAKYSWTLVQALDYAVSGYGPDAIGMGGIIGDLEREFNTLTIGGEPVLLPETAVATISYNGVGIVDEGGGVVYPVAGTFSSASISVYDPESGGGGPEVPEPGSFLLLVMGGLGLIALRRRT